MDFQADRLKAIEMYKSLTDPTIFKVDLAGRTMKFVIVSTRFDRMTFKQRIDLLKAPFIASELSTRYLASFEAYTPKETSDGGFCEDDFDDDKSGSSTNDKAAAKPAEI